MTQTTKTVNIKVAIALGILCVVTIVALNFSVYTYYTEMNNKNSQLQTLNDQIVDLQTQIANGTLQAAKLIEIDMKFTDNRTDISKPFLQVTGYIYNTGLSSANNSVFHVTATRTDNAQVIDSSTNIGTIEAGTYTKIDIQIPYNGTPLVEYSDNLEWAT